MSKKQRTAIDQMLRAGTLDVGGDVGEQRQIYTEMMQAFPLPSDVRTSAGTIGGVPVLDIAVEGQEPAGTVLFFHGGGYAFGSAANSAGFAAEIARRTGARVASVDYRLAPENPYPAALDDAVAAYRGLLDSGVPASEIALAGESAGGGVALALAQAAADLPRPAAVYLTSPWTDLTLSGDSMTSNADADAVLYPEGLRRRARDYAGSGDPANTGMSPGHADLDGLPPLLLHAGGDEVLLNDATRTAARAAAAGVSVTLEVTPEVPHNFVSLAGVRDGEGEPLLEEADWALDRAARFLREHLDGGGWRP